MFKFLKKLFEGKKGKSTLNTRKLHTQYGLVDIPPHVTTWGQLKTFAIEQAMLNATGWSGK